MNAKYIKYDRESDRFNLIVDAVLSLFTLQAGVRAFAK